MRRLEPRPVSTAVQALAAQLAPATPLAAVQGRWPEAVGEPFAQACVPVSERAGIVTVACRSAVWAQEADLAAPTLVERLNAALGRPLVRGLRCSATGWEKRA